MSSDNAQSTITYTSISSNSDGPSWGIPLMNAGELPKMDPYKELAQQGQVHPLSPAYIPDLIELDEHAPVYVLEPQHPEYHAPSDDDIQVEDDDEDPEEDPNEEHESKGSDETEPFKEDKIFVTPPPSRHHRARIYRIFALTGPPLGCDVAESLAVNAARAPRSQYDFVDTVEAGQGLIRSPAHDTRTIARAADRAEDASYCQSAEDLAVTQMMRIHTLEARAYADTVEDADSGSLMCTKFIADETEKVDKYISGLPDNIHGNVMSARPKTLDETSELANDLMDQKLRTYAERHNENKRKANDSPRNNQ
nr:reverse transcriptase domain-containing protein [Tanacetum cinerariifolium]